MAQSSAVIILVLILGPVMPQHVWDVFFCSQDPYNKTDTSYCEIKYILHN